MLAGDRGIACVTVDYDVLREAPTTRPPGCSESAVRPVLVVIGGLPGSGKSTIATALARETSTPYVRVDRVEQAVVDWTSADAPGRSGRLRGGARRSPTSSSGWDWTSSWSASTPPPSPGTPGRRRPARPRAGLVEVEVVCSDPVEHRRRVEERATDVVGLVKPTWAEVVGRDYQPWDRSRVVVDNRLGPSVAAAVQEIAAAVAARRA